MSRREISLFLALGPWLLAALLSGCGQADGPERFDVTGTVTFDGAPVPTGTIVFTPDSSKGNDGPQGVTEIRDGIYDTRKGGKGVIGGPHIVRIRGFDDKAFRDELGDLQASGRPLFPLWETTLTFESRTTNHDFEIPAKSRISPGAQ